MKDYSPKNVRIKRRYVEHLRYVRGHSSVAVEQFVKAIDRFENYTKHTDFEKFHIQQVIAFQQHLADQRSVRTGDPLSQSTIYTTLNTLKTFFAWLADQPGYRKHFHRGDWEYFNPSRATKAIAKAHRTPRGPSLDQIRRAVAAMPTETDVHRRNRALLAFILITASRVTAVTSLQLRHVDIEQRLLLHDARSVQTKFRKTFDSWFYPLGDDFEAIVIDWVRFLSERRQWTLDDPLFPATKLEVGTSGQFEPTGLTREHWKGTGAIREIFRDAFAKAGLPYFNPHSFRNTVIAHGCSLNLSWDEMQAWAQNMGHESLTTTFGSYGRIASRDQGTLVRNAGKRAPANASPELEAIASMVRDLHAKQVGQ